jgi:translation initiation factor 3 subunit H
LPNFVSGSLLGLESSGVLEITHSFPFPEPSQDTKSTSDLIKSSTPDASPLDGLDGHEYQLEMMKMLREVNVDNNCVGWYQSMCLGSFSTASLLENQLSYQTDLSRNAVVLLYDPMQTAHGNLELKCLRLTEEAVELLTAGRNSYLDPHNIFESVPIVMKNPSLVKALLHNVKTGQYSSADSTLVHNGVTPQYETDTTFDRLDLSTNPYLEKHLEFLSTWVDDLAAEQGKFQFYSRAVARASGDTRRGGDKRRGVNNAKISVKSAWQSSEAPRRIDSLLISNQIRNYCDQVDKFTDGGLGKLFVMEGLQKKV